MNTLILLGLLIGYLLIGTFIYSIVISATDGDIDCFWLMLFWPFFIVACILAGIFFGVITAGQFIGEKICDKLN